jgi:hypothetical protein
VEALSQYNGWTTCGGVFEGDVAAVRLYRVQNSNVSITLSRHQSLERYRRVYLRQNGYSPDAMLPTDPEAESSAEMPLLPVSKAL